MMISFIIPFYKNKDSSITIRKSSTGNTPMRGLEKVSKGIKKLGTLGKGNLTFLDKFR
jgi:hypothetical protein